MPDPGVTLTPVDHDPFADLGLILTPVQGDPFANPAAANQVYGLAQPPIGQPGAAPLDDFAPAPTQAAQAAPVLPGLASVASDPSRSMGVRVPAAIGSAVADQVGGLARSAWGAATLPGDVATGKVDPNSLEAIRRSTDLAGLLTLPAADAGAVVDPSSLGIFAGAKAKTADLDALSSAQQLAKSGLKSPDVYNITGWLKGVDEQHRFEIPDAGSYMMPEGFDANPPRNITKNGEVTKESTLGQILNHPDLFAAYPDLASTEVVLNPNYATGGYYRPPYGSNPEAILLGGDTDKLASDPRSIHSTLLHEVQHAIAQREGFSGGSNSRDAGSRENYLRNAGEVEARNVQNRWENPDQALLPPWRTQDVPSEQQWVTRQDAVAASPGDRQPLPGVTLTPVQGNPFASAP